MPLQWFCWSDCQRTIQEKKGTSGWKHLCIQDDWPIERDLCLRARICNCINQWSTYTQGLPTMNYALLSALCGRRNPWWGEARFLTVLTEERLPCVFCPPTKDPHTVTFRTHTSFSTRGGRENGACLITNLGFEGALALCTWHVNLMHCLQWHLFGMSPIPALGALHTHLSPKMWTFISHFKILKIFKS